MPTYTVMSTTAKATSHGRVLLAGVTLDAALEDLRTETLAHEIHPATSTGLVQLVITADEPDAPAGTGPVVVHYAAGHR